MEVVPPNGDVIVGCQPTSSDGKKPTPPKSR